MISHWRLYLIYTVALMCCLRSILEALGGNSLGSLLLTSVGIILSVAAEVYRYVLDRWEDE